MLVERVPTEVTYPLRARVLDRPGADAPETVAFAIRDRDEVVASGVVAQQPDGTWRIRGMAVVEERRGRGLGTAVLRAILGHVDAHGGGTVWCNARIRAVSLYERFGFVTEGEPFDDRVAGVEVRMVRAT